ncbi:SUKH-3 domain-containing protein [Ruminococcus albus]|uniref:SUKH-3 immunity protein n=1 Tax=Ruminococcus albus TaxID=1264 RepID=A0A1I1L1E2_RUMAL|nr:SUKH-3 domain-containing protein [Ruminococcus albus]SFC66887.1 SUKH-3 immunity protein [Ruminococcus albus]
MKIYDEEIKKVLIRSGWNEDRNYDISEYIALYKQYGYDIPIKVKEVLSAFCGLVLKIPCYRYWNYYRVTGKNPGSEDDFYYIIHIDPKYFFSENCAKSEWLEARTYAKDMAAFLKIKDVYPFGHIPSRDCCFLEFYIGENGEFIGADEGACYCFGSSFEEGIKKIMTSSDTDFECF